MSGVVESVPLSAAAAAAYVVVVETDDPLQKLISYLLYSSWHHNLTFRELSIQQCL